MHAAKEPPGQPEGDGEGEGVGFGGNGLGGEGVGGTGDGVGVGAGLHFLGSGPCTTVPVILRFETLKLEAPKFPSPPQLPGTHPVHWDE
jgi:hypothetical protein